MTTRTLVMLFAAGVLGACGGSSGSDLFSEGGSGGTGASSAGGSNGGSSASGGSAGDAGTGNTGNSGGDGGVGGSSFGGTAASGATGGSSTGGTGGGTGGSDGGTAGIGGSVTTGGAGGSAGSGGTTGGSGGAAGAGNAGTGGTTGGTGGSAAGTGGTGGTGGGTVQGDPGVVTCNGSACRVDQGNKCCVPWYGSNPTGTCIGQDADCDGNGFQDLKNDITCNGPEDCQIGQHCCGETETIGFGGSQRTVYDRLSCKNSCGNDEVTVCGDFPGECGSTQVCAQSSLLESGYNICRNP